MAAENRLDYLRKQFAKIDDETFCKLVACDTTPTKKYATWLLNLNSKSNLNLDNLNDAIQAIELFESLKDSLPKNHRDINTFKSISSLLFSINSWLIERFNENENKTNFLKKGAELLFENEDIFIIKLLSFEGSVNYGSNTKWCTLQSKSFYEYSDKGSLYIVQCKTDKYFDYFSKKSQLHFSNDGDAECRAVENQSINLIDIIIKNKELYDCFDFLRDKKHLPANSDLYGFFNLNTIDSANVIYFLKKYGFDVICFMKEMNLNLLNNIFDSFGEDAYDKLPYSKDKLISFVSTIENGLKRIIKKGEYEICDKMIKASVESFPENILLIDCKDERIWKEVIKKESWIIKKSPFYKDADEMFEIVTKVNISVLNYINPIEIFTLSQRENIAYAIVENSCDNYLTLLASLGELGENTQIQLVKKVPASIHYIVLPTEKTFEACKIAKAKEIKKQKQEEKKQQANIVYKTWIDDDRDCNWNDYRKYDKYYSSPYGNCDDYSIIQKHTNDNGIETIVKIDKLSGQIIEKYIDYENKKY